MARQGRPPNPISERQKRDMRRHARKDWASDAYWYYTELLRQGLDFQEPDPEHELGRLIPHVDIPEEIEALPVLSRRELPAHEVARWAYLSRRLDYAFTAIAKVIEGYAASPEREADVVARIDRARADGDVAAVSRLQGGLEVLRLYYDTEKATRTRSDRSISHAIAANAIIWTLAEHNFA